jgi:hypothetical protein
VPFRFDDIFRVRWRIAALAFAGPTTTHCSTADIEVRVQRNADELTRFHLDDTSAVFIIE